ncbi:DEAD/DEAH box helicase family protein [Romboutsia lituseburensis]|uniref:DEAD/DEAH box helicase family protein n=1 Tax=Romboutsia lituseburensis TaxID=1537 RepID=UPI00215AB1E4|nr:DEAD/DEAH box helicase family protein [Romboutsia lituseburensis]MCR8744260.1 DEAD/DEAH box helicase family protein [Romboutsia lituseburensis]
MSGEVNKYSFSGKIEVSDSSISRSLYIHQKEAIKELTNQSEKDIFKSLLVIPTGGGKTFTTVYWVLKEMINNNKKVLWLAHRHELLNQTLNTAANTAYKDVLPNIDKFTYRIISGSSEHDNPVNITKEDDFIIASKDSLNYNKEYLQKWLDNNKDNVCLVIDEAHHATAKTYRNIINMVEKSCKNNLKVIGLTATPTRTSEKEKGLLGKIFTDGICYSVDLKTLVNNGILSKPEFIDLKTDYKMDRELNSYELNALRRFQNLPDSIAKQIALNKERNNFIVDHYINNKSKYGKCLVFAVNIDHAIALNALFIKKGIKSDYVVSSIKDGYTGVTISAQENEKKILDFRNDKLDILINVNILTEGTDIPNVETVFLTRQTTSSILMNQMIGRGLRGKSAGGTENAYIVSFIDDWKYRINWVSPKRLLNYGEFDEKEIDRKRSLGNTLVPIKMIEEFAKLMDSSIEKKWVGKDYMELVPIGSYCFNIFDEENDIDKNCEVLVFDNLKNPYEQLIEDLEYIFRKFNVNEEGIDEPKIDSIYNHILDEIFEGYDLDLGFNEEDIKDIIMYYELAGEKLELIEFEGREEFNIANLVDDILDKRLNRFEEAEYIKNKWEDKSLGWSIYFNDEFLLFNSEIDREMRNRFIKESHKKPKFTPDHIDYTKLSLYQIKKLNPKRWREINDEVYDNYRDEEGYYVSASGKYRSKKTRYFQIDHIVPISKGGLTIVENLQLLTRWENAIKGNTVGVEFEQLDEDYQNEALLECCNNGDFDKVSNIIKTMLDYNPKSLAALNMKAKIQLEKESYTSAIKIANQVLKLDEDNEYAMCTKAHCYRRQGKPHKAIELYEKIIDIYGEYEHIYVYLGDCYYELRKYNIAINQYHNALEINDNRYDANFALGWIYSRNRRYELSNKYYLRAAQIDSECSSSLNNIGLNYFKLGEYEKALEYYEKALELDPDERIYINNKADVLEKLNETLGDIGIQVIEDIEEIDDEDLDDIEWEEDIVYDEMDIDEFEEFNI